MNMKKVPILLIIIIDYRKPNSINIIIATARVYVKLPFFRKTTFLFGFALESCEDIHNKQSFKISTFVSL